MRIALVSMHTSPIAVPGSGDAGGMNVVVAEAAKALSALGHDVTLVTRATADLAPGEYTVPGGVDRAARRPILRALEAGDPALRKAQLPRVVPEFAAGLKALGEFDAVHAHYWLSGVAALEAFARTPALTFHTLAAQKNAMLAPGDAPEPKERLDAERLLAQRSFVIAGSSSELNAVTQYCGAPTLGSEVVHPGVDTALFHPSSQSGSTLRVTVLGRVQPLKGQDLAVRAMGELVRAFPDVAAGVELVIAGEPTPGAEAYAAGLRDLATEYGIASKVRFLPAQTREQAAALLASSALVLVPSHSETFGLTALEAAASGVPVIVGGHTGLIEAAPETSGGIHMGDRDPRNWARAMAELLADPHRRANLGRAARAHAEQHNWLAHARALERIYSAL